jgi:hypothetical protein
VPRWYIDSLFTRVVLSLEPEEVATYTLISTKQFAVCQQASANLINPPPLCQESESSREKSPHCKKVSTSHLSSILRHYFFGTTKKMNSRQRNCWYSSAIIFHSAFKSSHSFIYHYNKPVGSYNYHSSYASLHLAEAAIGEDDKNIKVATTTANNTNYRYDVNLATDRRPFEQRVKRPRKARRLNHSFMHLYRYVLIANR